MPDDKEDEEEGKVKEEEDKVVAAVQQEVGPIGRPIRSTKAITHYPSGQPLQENLKNFAARRR